MYIFVLLLILLSGCEATPQTKVLKVTPTPNNQILPSPSPKSFEYYQSPNLNLKEVYWVALIGDSMTEALGPHGGPMTEKLNQLFETYNRDILVDNYAVGSTNLSNAQIRLRETTQAREWVFDPILQRKDLDLIIIESFGYNPLSHITNRQEALAEQNRLLLELMSDLTQNLPNTRIVFMATLAPNRQNYAQNSSGLSDEESTIQADERIEYLQNHIKFANDHGIPVINIFEKSLSPTGDGQTKFINPNDWIHPSHEGVELISKEMAEFIFANKILPY